MTTEDVMDQVRPPAPIADVLVELHGVVKSYRRGPEEVHALRGVDLSLHAREVVALIGPSGSGKTTLLNLLCGWESPDAGEIRWRGAADTVLRDLPWRELAVLPQDLGLLEELSIRENVELPLRLADMVGPESAKRVGAMLEGFGLDRLADRSPSEVSLGEQQRTALGRALVASPRLLLADEPTGHQDEGWARVVMRSLRLAAREGTSCLVATHNREAIKYVDEVIAIRDGLVRRTGTPTRT
ncbi:MAG TPA: ATP-binding cassette domain-containing protein [Actinomycetota bacterium]|nr:ATP-binding cassette domain-containing protein [Actinomycetota bacterium]